MLKITKATDPIEVKNLTVCIIGDPGLGKTSTAFTAEKPLLLDFDHGVYRAKNRRDSVEIDTWNDVTDIKQSDLADYRTLVVDTVGRALDCLAADIMFRDPKAGRGGSLTLQGYGALKGQFTSWLRMMRAFGLDVVLVAHIDEQKKGDDTIVRLDAQGSSKNEIYKSADAMGRLYLDKGRRVLNFSPTDVAFGKNPGQLGPLVVPDFAQTPDFLAGAIAETKAALNQMSAVQTETAATLEEWKTQIDAASSMTDFDAMVAPIKVAEGAVKENAWRLLVKAAKTKGFVFDRKTGVFDLAPAKAAA